MYFGNMIARYGYSNLRYRVKSLNSISLNKGLLFNLIKLNFNK